MTRKFEKLVDKKQLLLLTTTSPITPTTKSMLGNSILSNTQDENGRTFGLVYSRIHQKLRVQKIELTQKRVEILMFLFLRIPNAFETTLIKLLISQFFETTIATLKKITLLVQIFFLDVTLHSAVKPFFTSFSNCFMF